MKLDITDNSITSSKFYGSKLNILGQSTTEKKNKLFNTDEESINKNYNDSHYFCTKCHMFPFIKFNKDRKNVRLTCSCFNNKKILIEEVFKIYSIESSLSIFLSKSNLNINIENEFKCKEHNKKFKGFSKYFLSNYCDDCDNYINEKFDNDIIRFNDIKIEEKKIEELTKIINENNDVSQNIIKYEQINGSTLEKSEEQEEEEKRFKKLINIIINDYKNYPNFLHFFNIRNLLYFFNIEDKPIEKEEDNIINNFVEKKESIIIEYINNISNKTKLFSKIFVKNNKSKFKIEIEGKRIDLIEFYEFKTKEKKSE